MITLFQPENSWIVVVVFETVCELNIIFSCVLIGALEWTKKPQPRWSDLQKINTDIMWQLQSTSLVSK